MGTSNPKCTGSSPADVARAYIDRTHGSIGESFHWEVVEELLTDDFLLKQENVETNKAGLQGTLLGWSSIVQGKSWVKIHSVMEQGCTVLAHWETSYEVKPSGQTWYGSTVDISGKKCQGFTVFASFTVNDIGQITAIHQRSDDVVRKLGIEREVLTQRWEQEDIKAEK